MSDTQVSVFKTAGLPSVTSLTAALKTVETGNSVGGTILKCDKTGTWVFGADQTVVEDGSKWAVNPYSFVHGYIAWGRAVVLGEKMVPITEPLPDPGPAPACDNPPKDGYKGWQMQIGVSLKCIDGEDAGMEARFSTTSVGGKRAIQELALKIAEAVEADQTRPVAVIELKSDNYAHKDYGKVYVPVFDVQSFGTLEDPLAKPAAPPVTEASPAPTNGRRRRAG